MPKKEPRPTDSLPKGMTDLGIETLNVLGQRPFASTDPPPPEHETRPFPPTQPSPADITLENRARQLLGHPVVVLDPLWHDRAKQLAARDGVDVGKFVEDLIRRRWSLGPMAHPKPR